MDSSAPAVVQSLWVEPAVTMLVSWGFEDLYRNEYPGLVAVATAMTGDVRDGEDLVQDTMVKTFVRWERVGRLDRPGAWCHRVLINACRSRLRRRRTERRFWDRARRGEPSTPEPSSEISEFWAVVRTMPTRPRQAVAMYFAGDRSVAEIAAILECPEGTVRSDLSRARVVLAERLGY